MNTTQSLAKVRKYLCVLISFLDILTLIMASCASGITQVTQSPEKTLNAASSTEIDAISVYDGTYSGTFFYEYEKLTWDADRELPGGEIVSPWISATLKLELTFQTISFSIDRDWVELSIIYIVCDDPVFGTGANGITPDNSNAMNAYAYFPLPPDKTINPNEGINLVINFPNGSSIRSYQGKSNRGTFFALPNASRLLYSYQFTSLDDIASGAFRGFAATGPFSPVKDYPDYFVRTTGWTLAKVGSF